MKTQLLTVTLLLTSLNSSFASSCEKEYSELGRKIFTEKVCSKVRKPSWAGGIFSKSYNQIEKFIEKYCDNTPEVLCQEDMNKDIIEIVESAEQYIENKQSLKVLFNFDEFFTPIKNYIDENKGIPAISIDRNLGGRDENGNFEESVVLRGYRTSAKATVESFEKCNEEQRTLGIYTCMGELRHFFKSLYQTVKHIHGSTHLHIVSMCLEDSGFGECKYSQFKK